MASAPAPWPRPGARRHPRPRLGLLAAPLLLVVPQLLAGAALDAQAPTAELAGHVSDALTGSAMAGAVVLVPGTLLHTRTDSRGDYRLVGMTAGRHTIRILLLGYQPVTRDSVLLRAGETRRLDVAMKRAVIELAPVSVTASQVTRGAGQSAASVAVLTQQQVASRNVVTLDQALRYVPGVTFNHGDIDVRGSSGVQGGVGSRVLVMVDGHPVLSADGGETDFDALPLLDIDRVEVVKGAYSAIYGSNALGGVVNVISSQIDEEPVTSVRAYFGAYDLPSGRSFSDHSLRFKGIAAQHSRRIGKLGARIFAGRHVSTGYRADDSTSRWLFSGRLAYPVASDQSSSAYITYSWERSGNFFTWRDADHPYDVPAGTEGDWSHYGKLSAGTTIVAIAHQGLLFQLTPYLEHDDSRNHYHDNSDFHRATKAGSGAQLTIAPSLKGTVTVGAEASHTSVTSNFLGRPVGDSSEAFLGRPTLDDYGLYAQGEQRLTERLTGSLGARFDSHRATGSGAEHSVSPKLGMTFQATPSLSTRLSVGHGYRAPAAIEQFVSTVQSGFHIVPNPELHGESAWSAEIGATSQITPWLWIDGALFESWYRDLIGPGAAARPLEFQFQNITRARVRGIDLEAKLSAIPELLSLDVTYLYLDTRDESMGGPLPYRSPHNLTATIAAFQGLVGLDVRYRSRVQRVLVFPLDLRGSSTIVDLRLAYRIKGTTLQAKASNLFQAKYVDVMERNLGAPRSVMLTASRDF
jgi:outer membrane receptor for ferrienterochelin and colicins